MYESLPMFQRQGPVAYKKDLSNIIKLCTAMENPQSKLTVVHIAGSNGKGSVSHILSALFQAQGYKTGLYVSPHYIDFRERIKVDGQYISRKEVCRFIEKYRLVFEEIKPSFFEMTVAMAFDYFARQRVDIAILETGLGGRLDSTNIVDPVLSVITNISWDHSDLLGDSLEKIAFEKGGIIKESKPVIIGRKQNDLVAVFKSIAESKNAPLYFAEEILAEFNADLSASGIEKISTKICLEAMSFKPDLTGNYQVENFRTALASFLLFFKHKKKSPDKDKIHYGLEHVVQLSSMMGRWQKINDRPLTICESAHNEDGIRFLISQLHTFKDKLIHIVCGFVRDKDLQKVLTQLPKDARYYFVAADIPRALEADALQEQAKIYGLHGKAYSSVRKGYAAAKQCANEEDLILITGSIFVVGEVLELRL